MLESLLFSHLVELLPEFKREYTNVDVEITMGQAADLLVQLKQSQLDMVYISANLSGDGDLKCWFKKEERLVFLAAPGHALAGREKVCLTEVFGYDFLVTERSGGCYRRLQELAAGFCHKDRWVAPFMGRMVELIKGMV